MSVARRLRRKHLNEANDWVGGVVQFEGAPGAPPQAVAIWLQGGEVLGQCPAPLPDQHEWDACDGAGLVLVKLLGEIASHRLGPAPARVRVESPELAQLLRRIAPPFVTLVCAPTPELDRWVTKRGGGKRTQNSTGALDFSDLPPIDRLASEIFELKPWYFLAPLSVFHLRAPALGLEDAALTLMSERSGHASVYVFEKRAALEEALNAGNYAFDALAGCELYFERDANLGAIERQELSRAGWWFPEDDPTMRFSARYQEAYLTFRQLSGRELDWLRVGTFALQGMFGDTLERVDVTKTAIEGSWTVKLGDERIAHIDLRWPAVPGKGFAFFIPENNEYYLRHRNRVLSRLGFQVST